MARPDAVAFHNSQFPRGPIQVGVSNTHLAPPQHVPPGFYLLYCDKRIRWIHGPSGVTIVPAGPAPTVTNVGTAGAATVTYVVVAVMAGGDRQAVIQRTAESANGTTATANATQTPAHYNHLAWTAVVGAVKYEIYRTVGGATQGLIATVTAPTVTYDDTGAAGGGETPPAAATFVGNMLPPETFFGPVLVDASGLAYFDAITTVGGETGTLEFVECCP